MLIANIIFLDIPVKYNREAYEKIMEMSRNRDYTIGNSSYSEYNSKYYKLIATVLSTGQQCTSL